MSSRDSTLRLAAIRMSCTTIIEMGGEAASAWVRDVAALHGWEVATRQFEPCGCARIARTTREITAARAEWTRWQMAGGRAN